MNRSAMPTKKQINIHHGRVANDSDCMACGVSTTLERCHITARHKGGSDDPSNIHLLCRSCHSESESWQGDAYNAWFLARQNNDLMGAWYAAMMVLIETANKRGWLSRELSNEQRQSYAELVVKEFRC